MTDELNKQSGFLLVDKPAGWTSFDIVAKLRTITNIKKIGHTGTLDPFATGLLIIAIGREATKQISNFIKMDKIYEAEIILGATTATLDTEAEPIFSQKHFIPLSIKKLQSTAKKLTGNIQQIPPMHSAIKVNGQKLYNLARQGKTIELEPRNIKIYQFEIVDVIPEPNSENSQEKCLLPIQTIYTRIKCSSGTYIRALARDFAKELNTVGYLKNLRRIKINHFNLKNAIKITTLTSENWRTYVKSLDEMAIDDYKQK